jgi:glycerophosphoryl diester phosphodiesterase
MSLPAAFTGPPITHRALHDKARGRPENSPEAIEAAIKAGFGIEIDLQLSSDNEAMVFHDYDLARLTGLSGAIRQRSAAELGAIPLLGGKACIPTLAQILAQIKTRVPLLIELKDQHGQMGETDGALEKATAKALKGYDGLVALMSFNPHMIARMVALAPNIPRGLTTSAYTAKDWPLLNEKIRAQLREIPDYARTKSCFISHEAADLKSPHVARLKASGATVLCWTIRSPEAEAKAREIADNVTFEGYLP